MITDHIEAVIFDMDGVLIDSVDLWQKAEAEIFSALGVQLSEEGCAQTSAMTTDEVTRFWHARFPWTGKSLEVVENEVIDYVGHLIQTEAQEIKGIHHLLAQVKQRGYKIGLATNAPYRLIPIVLNKLNISAYFDMVSSAEQEVKGKPDPAIYLNAAKMLHVAPANCLVFEDSYYGTLAAKNAGMKVVALVPETAADHKVLALADKVIHGFESFSF
ncbi:hexitol phosphatase HxpB [Taibaiella sp. KBW10]|uniref:hexitol phosphatase HxpB n=1 Tax=Taibaiella sp. KBW10 TaxID=2153357 RepID=UPI000F58F653|nr:hexitol phosphatase HxpB [Taibaiella sp. KBW10]RQO32616.1 hexitol phosphatase HxpB [Taibaiella sp. KBW10]